MSHIFDSNGFWFTVGIVFGTVLDVGARLFVERLKRPVLGFPKGDNDALQRVDITVGRYYLGQTTTTLGYTPLFGKRRVFVWRLKVKNRGKSAAENAQGTIERWGDTSSAERRICWYEEPRNRITLNREDHSYLDFFGVVNSNGRTQICFPTEHGWDGEIYPILINSTTTCAIRVTSSNCEPRKATFQIDPSQECKPVPQ